MVGHTALNVHMCPIVHPIFAGLKLVFCQIYINCSHQMMTQHLQKVLNSPVVSGLISMACFFEYDEFHRVHNLKCILLMIVLSPYINI